MKMATIALFLTLLCMPAHAGDLLTMMRTPGEWEMTMAGGPMAPTAQKACYRGDKSVADMTTSGLKNCSQKNVNVSGALGTVDAVCSMNGLQVTVHATVHPTGDAAFHSDTQIHLDGMPKIAGFNGMFQMSIDAHRIGPCQPGDKVM
jgi:hypothetical protein